MKEIPFSKTKKKKRRKTKSIDEIETLKEKLIRGGSILAGRILTLCLDTIEERQRLGIECFTVAFKDEQDLANQLNIPIEELPYNDLCFAFRLGSTMIAIPSPDFETITHSSLFCSSSLLGENDEMEEITVQMNPHLLKHPRNVVLSAMFTAIRVSSNILI